MKKLFIIIPAYCEEDTIEKTIYGLREQEASINNFGFDMFIYVVNDGSTDKTAEKAKSAGADRIAHHRVNQGLGSAVRTGLEIALRDGADVVIKFDADAQHDPKDIVSIMEPIINDEAEIVYGNRFEKINYKMPFIRKSGNVIFTKLMRWMTNWPVIDSQPGIFAVSREYLEISYIPGDYNYSQQILLDAFHKGMRFAQVPVAFNRRTKGSSFVSLRYPFKVLPQIIQVIVGVKPLKVFGPIGLFFLGIGTLTAVYNLTGWFFGAAEKPIQNVNLVLGTGLFGLHTLFFGLLADLIVKQNADRKKTIHK